MRIRPFFLLLLLLALPAHAAPACGLPLPAPAPAMHMPHAAEQTGRLNVLAVGSGSLQENDGKDAHPIGSVITERLQQALPGRDISVRLISRRGQTAVEMLATLRSVLTEGGIDLVLWQTGTVEAIRAVPPTSFRATLDEGLRLIHVAGADAVLIDPQYSRRLTGKLDMQPYRRVLIEAAQSSGAALFDRFTLMKGWADSGRLDLDRTSRADRAAALAQLQTCLVDALARTVQAGVAP